MQIIQIHPADNTAVCLSTVTQGTEIAFSGGTLTALNDIPCGHKISLTAIAAGENIIKYGFPIGHATAAIKRGMWIHTHNCGTNLHEKAQYAYHPLLQAATLASSSDTFLGYRRADGVGIRNEIWIVPTVGCLNTVAENIARKAAARIRGAVDGVYAFPHPYGCSQLGDDHENTKNALCGLIRHPNAAGVLVLGLGCENNGIDGIQAALGHYDTTRVAFLSAQVCKDEVAEALQILEALIADAATAKREPCPVSRLVVGLKCGGSDSFSGITANPLVGAFADRLAAVGGSVILTEVPEMFGAETLLMKRCVSARVFDQTVDLINTFKDFYIRHGQPVYENPSPGNKAGGITTLEEKSLGCTQKSGTSNVVDVLRYGEPLKRQGLNLLAAPGNDLVAASAEAISGAHMVLFTTGRGTPFGCPVPTVKIASNTALYQNKRHWIDFDAGCLTEGYPMDALADALYQYVLQVAEGRALTLTEQKGIRDFAIFKTGVTL